MVVNKKLKLTVFQGVGIVSYSWTVIQGESCIITPTTFPINNSVNTENGDQEISLNISYNDTVCLPILKLTLFYEQANSNCEEKCFKFDLANNTTSQISCDEVQQTEQYYECNNNDCIALAPGVLGTYDSPNCDNHCGNQAQTRWFCTKNGCEPITVNDNSGFATQAECEVNCTIDYVCLSNECIEKPDNFTGPVYPNDPTCNNQCCSCNGQISITPLGEEDGEGNKCYFFDNGGDGFIYLNNDYSTDISGTEQCPECGEGTTQFAIIFDRSGSVNSLYQDIKDSVQTLVDNLKTTGNRVDLYAFNNNIDASINVNSQSTANFLNTTAATSGGNTSALDNAINSANLNFNANYDNNVMIVITDGYVNSDPDVQSAFNKAEQSFLNAHNTGYRILTLQYLSGPNQTPEALADELLTVNSAWLDGNNGQNGKNNDNYKQDQFNDLAALTTQLIQNIPQDSFKVDYVCCDTSIILYPCNVDECQNLTSGNANLISICLS